MLTVTLGPSLLGERSGPALSGKNHRCSMSLSMRALVAMPSTHTHRKLRGFAGLQATYMRAQCRSLKSAAL